MNKKIDINVVIREKFGSQEKFGEVIERDQSDVSRILRGQSPLRAQELPKWSKALGLPVDVIIISLPERSNRCSDKVSADNA